MTRLLTVGHGAVAAEDLLSLVRGAGVRRLVDVRRAPASRRHPHFSREALAQWLPEGGVEYRWEPALGGFRQPAPDSPNRGLRHSGFRGYADHMGSGEFRHALERLLAEAAQATTAAMCAEGLWWRCHRRLLSDAAVLLAGVRVDHLLPDGRLEPHRPTEGVRRAGDGLVYDLGEPTLPGL